jgi:PTS system mannose-specific IIB component/fructoselysine and glucoselysine-specific PTS system IIB component
LIVLYRVDERLIHGQVVIGWGSQLRPHRYVVIDDALATSEWEQELYRLGLPEGREGEFLTVQQAIERVPLLQKDESRTVLLTRDLETMVRLAETGALDGVAVNLGGVHHAPGRTQVCSYVYLDDQDRQHLQRLQDLGTVVSARDLPGSVRVSFEHLLRG